MIYRVSILTKKTKLALVTFRKERTVSEIYWLADKDDNETNFNAFPHVPRKAMARNEGMDDILKRL